MIISPLPGTRTALRQTQISFLGAPLADLSHVSVVGSSSGKHAGQLRAYAGLTGTSFVPMKPFLSGEQVAVTARMKGQTLHRQFGVAIAAHVPLTGFPPVPSSPADFQSFRSRPDLKPPAFAVSTPAGPGVAPGDLFLTPGLGTGNHRPVILDGRGSVVWSQPEPAGADAADLRVESFQGKPVLTFWEGKFLSPGFGQGQGVVLGSDYRPVTHVRAGNGLQADLHEFKITPNGTALITSFSAVRANLSSAKGPSRGVAYDGAVQEVDIATGLVVWEWHSLSVVPPSASDVPALPKRAAPYDYFHVNSAFTTRRGNVLVSARNTSSVYLISRRSGKVIWRLGGKKSSFKLGAGVRFAFQHDAQQLPDGTISLFDDQAAPPVKPPSSGKVIRLDLAKRTAALVHQFRHTPPLLTFSQGNLESLPNGNSLVGWGGLPNVTEFDPRGQIVFDGRFPKHADSYRAFREPWVGQPADTPAMAVVPGPPGTGTAYVSWNGATQVSSWRLLAGPTAATLTAAATVPRAGFETAIPLPAGAAAAQVQALDSAGRILGVSKVNG